MRQARRITAGVTAAVMAFATVGALAVASPAGAASPNKTTITITPTGTKAYGAANPSSYTYSASPTGPYTVRGTLTCSTTATTTSTPGSYPLSSCTGLEISPANSYQLTYGTGSLNVTQAPLTVQAPSPSRSYGAANPALPPSYSGFVLNQTASALTTPAACSTTAVQSSPVASYPVTCSGAAATNYTFTYVDGQLAVTKAPLTATASSHSISYGSSVPAVSPSFTGFVNGDNPSAVSPKPTCSASTPAAPAPVGSYPTSCTGGAATNYALTHVPGTLTVGRAALTVAAPSPTIVYGDAMPALTPSYTGFAAGQTVADLTAPATCSTTATASSPAGTYPVTCSGASSDNYTVTHTAGVLTVSKKAVTVTAPSPSKHYGASVPALTPTFTGLPAAEQSAVTCQTAATQSSPVTTDGYAVSCSGVSNQSYDVTYVPGTLTVTPAALTVTASATKVYGEDVPTLTPVYSGLVLSQQGPATPAQCSTDALAASPVGAYTINCSGAVDGNYAITHTGGTLTVTPASLTISSSGNKVYGAPVLTLTSQYVGLVNGDRAPAQAATCSTIATAASAVASYDVTCADAADGNYDISYVTGSYAVTPAPATVSALATRHTYGSPPAAAEGEVSGLVNGDTALGTPATCSLVGITSETAAGSYPGAVVCSGASDANYNVTHIPADYTVDRASLKITSSSSSITYGDTATVTGTPSGFVAGEGMSNLVGTLSCSAAATTAGSHDTSCSGVSSANYEIEFVKGTLTVGKKALTITASSPSITYGQTATVTGTPSGFITGEGMGDLVGTLTCSAAATTAGSHDTSCSGVTSPNYEIDFVKGTVTVTKKGLTITASSASITYGDAATVTGTPSGFVNSDDMEDLVGTLSCTAAATTAGSHDTSCSGVTSLNYGIEFAKGTLTVAKKALTVTAPDATRNTGQANPTFTPTLTGFVSGESAADLSTTPTCSTTATTTSAAGTYPITCTGGAADNYSFTYQAGTLTVVSANKASSLLQPINTDRSSAFKSGSTIPVKFSIVNAAGQVQNVSDIPATITVTFLGGTSATTVNETVLTTAGDVGKAFRWDASSLQYHYNLSTKTWAMGEGRYRVDVLNGSTVITSGEFQVKR